MGADRSLTTEPGGPSVLRRTCRDRVDGIVRPSQSRVQRWRRGSVALTSRLLVWELRCDSTWGHSDGPHGMHVSKEERHVNRNTSRARSLESPLSLMAATASLARSVAAPDPHRAG
jgi:hypothetical protein